MTSKWLHSSDFVNSKPEETLGKKADYLIALKNLLKGTDFYVPDFSIIMPKALEHLHGFTKPKMFDKESDFVCPQKLPHECLMAYKDIFSKNAPIVKSAFDSVPSDNGFPVIRTSLLMDSDKWQSFAGVNHTAYPQFSREEEYLSNGLQNAFSGVYKPYSEWYLRRHDFENHSRDTAIIFTEFIDADVFGTLSINGTDLMLYVQSKDNQSALKTVDLLDEKQREALSPQAKKLASLAEHLRDIMNCPLEIEFRIDKNNSVYANQMREIAPYRKKSSTPKTLRSINLTDSSLKLRDLDRLIRTTSSHEDALFIVPNETNSEIDTFCVVAYMQEVHGIKDVNIAPVYDKTKPINHLLTVLEEDTYLGELRHLDKNQADKFKTGSIVEENMDHFPENSSKDLGR